MSFKMEIWWIFTWSALFSLTFADHNNNQALKEAQSFNGSRCIYSVESRQLMCQGPKFEFECEAFANFSLVNNFQLFGIERLPENFNYTNKETVKYNLYPRSFNNFTYFNRTFQIDGMSFDYQLYYGESFTEYGVRISDPKCFTKLVDFFRSSNENHQIKIGGNENDQVSLFGEILIVDKSVQKRFLMSMWGWPTLGWGWPALGAWSLWG